MITGTETTISQIVNLVREIDMVRYLLYSIWVVPIFRVYRAFKDRLLNIWAPCKERKEEKNVKVAVLIPARNVGKYIGNVIKSIVNQTVRPQLVIMIDDMSNDCTFSEASKKLKDLGGRLKNIKVKSNMIIEEIYELEETTFILKKNLMHRGKAKSLNRMLDYVKDFDYVMVLDSDTMVESTYIERLLDVMEKDPRSGAASGLPLLWDSSPPSRWAWWIAKAFRESSFLVYALTVKAAESKVKAVATLSGCCLLIRRKALQEINGFPVDTFAEDAELSLRLALRNYRLYFVPEALAYTVDPGSPLTLGRKLFRILRGMYTSFFRTISKILKKRLWGLSITAIYSIFGGIPLSVSLMNLMATTYLAARGYISSSILVYLASLLQFSEVSVILNLIAKYPLILIVASYLWGVIGSFLALLTLSLIYRKDNKRISRISISVTKYTPLVPLVLWLQAFIAIPAIMAAVRDLIRGVEPRW